MITNDVQKQVAASVKECFGIDITPEVSFPDPKLGDLSTNVAFTLSGKLKKSPTDVAQQIATTLKADCIKQVSVLNGFINIRVKDEILAKIVQDILGQSDNYGRGVTKNKRIMVEYGHPNTHKLPHIGHLFSYIAGDSLARLLEFNGNEVLRVNYQGDVGPHVAKAVWAWQQKGRPVPDTLEAKVEILQDCYQEGSHAYEKDLTARTRINQINKDIYASVPEITDDWKLTRQWSLDYCLQFENLLGVKQKTHYLESQIWERGLTEVKKHIGTVFHKSQGAVIFPGEQLGLHNRVFITQQGTPTYEAKDVGLNVTKMEDWPYDITLIPTAVEQNEYFTVVIAAINQAIPKLKDKIQHIGFGLVNLSSGKMSSRSGEILAAEELIGVAKNRALEVVAKLEHLDEDEQENIATEVALAAIKYGFLRSNLGKNISFDIQRDVSLEGNSGPYLQYSYARIASMLSKARKQKDAEAPVELSSADRERLLLLSKFPEVVATAADNLAPQQVAVYLYGLAQSFNAYYENNRIIGSDDENWRLALVKAIGQTLHNGLDLLGINTLQRM